MTFRTGRKAGVLLAGLALVCLATGRVSTAPAALPNPVLVFVGQQLFQQGGKNFMRYNYAVQNSKDYPAELFAAAPQLPPCGTNKTASRTWVDVYDQHGKRLNGFCALAKPADLNQLWFALEDGVTPPSWVYIEMTDRAANTKYKSNLAETTN
ncbi:MAG: hypothetical protein M3348_13585 [Acidobacteriota bacterium]|nr:hypothetical protein [Acidobacteriota bacterium]